MQLGKVINLRGFNGFFEFVKKNNILLIFALFFLFGFGFGIFSFSHFVAFKEFSASHIENLIELRSGSGFFKVTAESFFNSLTYIVLMFIFGSSVLGLAFLPFVTAAGGMLYGTVMAGLYSQYALKGIAFNAVMILPGAVIFSVALILSARESVGFSSRIAKLTLSKAVPSNLFYDFKNYCGRYIFICIIVLISAIVDAVISCYFADSFII